MAAQSNNNTRPKSHLLTPSLFVGPPSRNASAVDLRRIPTSASQNVRTAGQPSQSTNKARSSLHQSAFSNDPDRPGPSDSTASLATSLSSASSGGRTNSSYSTQSSTIHRPNNSEQPPSTSHSSGLPGLAALTIPTASTLPQNRPASQRYEAPTSTIPTSSAAPRPRRDDHTDAIWAEMQTTLGEVELGAGSNSTVFGRDHARALEELRMAQVGLAQAWARSDAADADGNAASETGGGRFGFGGAAADWMDFGEESLSSNGRGGDSEEVGNALQAMSTQSSAGGASTGDGLGGMRSGDRHGSQERGGKSRLEQETENDILLARKRRQANDRYFERVNRGVVEVVSKLEVVAQKMGGVEMESQEIWGDGDSVDSASLK